METTIIKQEFDEHNRETYRELSNGNYVKWWYLNDDWEKIECDSDRQMLAYEASDGIHIRFF